MRPSICTKHQAAEEPVADCRRAAWLFSRVSLVFLGEALKAVCLHGHLSCLWANVCPLRTLTCDQRWQWLNWGSVWHEVTHRQWPGWAPSVPQCHLWGLEAQGGEDRPRPHVSKARGCVSNPGSTDHALCIRLLFGNQRHQIRVFLLF